MTMLGYEATRCRLLACTLYWRDWTLGVGISWGKDRAFKGLVVGVGPLVLYLGRGYL